MTRLQWQALFRRNKISQRALAVEAGVSAPTISQYIRGRIVSKPLTEFLEKKFGEAIKVSGSDRLR